MSEHGEFRDLLERASRLPRSIDPPRDLWPGIETRIREQGAGGRRASVRRWVQLALAAGLLLVAARALVPRRSGWEVTPLTGGPTIGTSRLSRPGTLRVGEALTTDNSSSALVAVGDIGRVEVRPGSRLRLLVARPTDHRLALDRGAIDARVDAPPRRFFVETPAGTAVDLGCAYSLAVDSTGGSLLRVTAGYVEFQWHGRRSIVPIGASVATRPGVGPGTPWADDAPAPLRAALAAFDFSGGGAGAVRSALAAARAEDALSLWHLLSRVDAPLRASVYDRLTALLPPPAGVTRDAALHLDPDALARYWSRIERITWRKEILRGLRDIDPRTGLAR